MGIYDSRVTFATEKVIKHDFVALPLDLNNISKLALIFMA